jgi:hypothetical protein
MSDVMLSARGIGKRAIIQTKWRLKEVKKQ